MRSRGQIFSLDFLLSLVLAVLAIGLVLQFFELQSYDQKDLQLRAELETIGFGASDLLVSNPDVVCILTDTGGIQRGTLPNCLSEGGAEITKQNLGIPTAYECSISGVAASGCNATPSAATANIFAIKRKVVTYSLRQVPKAELEKCMLSLGGCNLVPLEVELRVWKA